MWLDCRSQTGGRGKGRDGRSVALRREQGGPPRRRPPGSLFVDFGQPESMVKPTVRERVDRPHWVWPSTRQWNQTFQGAVSPSGPLPTLHPQSRPRPHIPPCRSLPSSGPMLAQSAPSHPFQPRCHLLQEAPKMALAGSAVLSREGPQLLVCLLFGSCCRAPALVTMYLLSASSPTPGGMVRGQASVEISSIGI